MTRSEKRKQNAGAGKGTPTESDRKVLKRAQQPVSGETPDVGSVDGGKKIKPVDLSLHGDGITHWQDELPSRREREEEAPAGKKKD